MIVTYYERTPGGGARLVVDNEFLTIYVDHRFIWGEKALQKEYGLPEVIICKIEDLKCIEGLPTIDPVKHGRWFGVDDEPCEVWEFDKCGHIIERDSTEDLPNYCENCGAKMDERNESDEHEH